ncbi:MAG: LytR family transcriptional regulator [Chloroflexi bacterium]|nr:MAG: LytR family transcriptional regulator [Chloroflexota bacterium]
MLLGNRPGHRARASQGRLRPLRILTLAVTAIALSVGSGGFAYFLPAVSEAFDATGQVVDVPSPTPTPTGTVGPTPSPTTRTPGSFTVLLLGSDNDTKFIGDHVLTQSMIIVRVNTNTKKVVMMSIPRDLWVPLSTGGTAKIDGAYSYGGPGAAIATVENNFGIHIDDYIWIGLAGLVHVIDAIGGIDVVTSAPVLDDFYPHDIGKGNPYRYLRVAVLAGPQHLDGTHALEYVRSRHNDLQSDFGRSQRQQQVLLALKAKAAEISAADVPGLAAAMKGQIKTSMSLQRIATLLPVAASLDIKKIQQIVLLPPYTHGCGCPQGYVIPVWSLILPLVQTYFP